MRMERTKWLCGIALVSASGCSLLLDFDELKGDDPSVGSPDARATETDDTTDATDDTDAEQTGTETETTTDGTVTEQTDATTDTQTDATDVGGQTDVGLTDTGEGGAGACPNGCDDDDPCTEDTCTPSGCDNEPIVCTRSDTCMEASCVDGMCVETPLLGVVEDNYDRSVVGETIYRSELVGAGDRFFRATYGEWDGLPDIRLASFDRNGEEPLAEYSLSQAFADMFAETGFSDDVVPVSPAAVVADTRLGLTLNVYVAIRSAGSAADIAADVVRLTLNQNLELVGEGLVRVATEANYRVVSDRLGPAGGQPPNGGEPYVVWNGCTTTMTADGPRCAATEPTTGDGRGGLYIQVGDEGIDPTNPGDNFLRDPRPLSGLSAVTTDTEAGAMWMSNLTPSGIEVNTGFANGQPIQQVVQCHTNSGFTGYRMDASRSIFNVWTASWSKRSGSTFVGELTSLQCQSDSCVDLVVQPPVTTCPDPAPSGRIVETARSLVARSLARPGDPSNRVYQSFALGRSDADSADLVLLVNRVDFGDASEPADGPVNIEERVLAADSLDNAPDWPALATLSPDRLAVSWIEPGDAPDSETLHVQRYKICFGD